MLRHATLLIHARFQCQRLRSGQLQQLREISPLPNGQTTQPHVKLFNLLPHCHVALTHKLASTLALTPKVASAPWVLMLHRCLPQLQLAIAPFPRSHAQLPCTNVYFLRGIVGIVLVCSSLQKQLHSFQAVTERCHKKVIAVWVGSRCHQEFQHMEVTTFHRKIQGCLPTTY